MKQVYYMILWPRHGHWVGNSFPCYSKKEAEKELKWFLNRKGAPPEYKKARIYRLVPVKRGEGR